MTASSRAALELVFAGALWGFGFVATIFALREFTPTETLVYRFVIAGFMGELIYLLLRGVRFKSLQSDIKMAVPAGLLLASMLMLQTIGLKFTTATKSGFLTSLYVILVPLINFVIFRQSASWRNLFFVLLALGGTYMLVGGRVDAVNVGDLWTVACSVLAAFHIIYIGRVSNKVGNAFRFNNFQSLWCLLALLPFLGLQESVKFQTESWMPWVGILLLGLGSSVIAFYLQVRTQKILSDSTASMLFLLESPFAALFGFMILSERLSLPQALGALLILLASILQIVFDSSAKTTEKT